MGFIKYFNHGLKFLFIGILVITSFNACRSSSDSDTDKVPKYPEYQAIKAGLFRDLLELLKEMDDELDMIIFSEKVI